MTLARERAIAVAYLLSGDEDLREGVIAAQDMGVQVVLLGIPTRQRTNQSAALIREADEHVVIQREFWGQFFSATREPRSDPTTAAPSAAQTAGRAFGVAWLASATEDDVRSLKAGQPVIPKELDIELILETEKTLGSLRERDDMKREIRGGFWAAVIGTLSQRP
jgi:hypothetical protein